MAGANAWVESVKGYLEPATKIALDVKGQVDDDFPSYLDIR